MSDSKTVVHGASNSKTAVDEAFDSGTAKDGSLDSQVASFLAEIESISTEPSQTQENGHTDHSDVQTTHTHNSDLGFIIKPDATSVSSDKSDHRVRSTTGSAYRSMFVKGESEFVRSDDGGDNDRDGNVLNPDEELPKVSEWQMVQDEATQYYYYWNTVTNEVTWEIPPDYTQFLLLYKEYEERLAKIPQDKLRRLQQKAEIKK
nr:hypothetical protein BaRGS_030348 [Batillaria attramentaria]